MPWPTPRITPQHVKAGGILQHAHEHPGKDISDNVLHPLRKTEVLSLQARGEYLYAACGEGGLRVFDIAFIDDKAFSERITTAPVSPLGQRFYVETKYAAAVASPATIAPDPTRSHRPENFEQPVAGVYGYLYVADKYEGLILVGAGTLLDGNPLNNFLKRDVTFNPNNLLCGARNLTIVGNYAYVCCDAGLVVVSLKDPKNPQVTCVIGNDKLKCPTAVQVQFRFAYVCDSEGIKVLDVTRLDQPKFVSALPLDDARNIYLARTYAYVAAGRHGLVILDILNPPRPIIDQVYSAERLHQRPQRREAGDHQRQRVRLPGRRLQRHARGAVDFAGDARLDRFQSSARAPADRHLPHVRRAGWPSRRASTAIVPWTSRGTRLAVFGRVGARPLNLEEQQRMYLHDGKLWRVSDDPFDAEIYRPMVGPRPSAPLPRLQMTPPVAPEGFPVPPQEPVR